MHQYEEIPNEAVLGFCTHVRYMEQNSSSLLPLVSCFAKRRPMTGPQAGDHRR